ncbi:ER lumen protein-retaining receptor 1-like [Phymastichus coffea]|uniref:ER lumen protein-retaining receptor 1-like n=1 Tax=Phymastichus coffea TaxID=108790 RepID=UPI00273AC399|nr:ER lumen protein-retaining receptor 1-like [Phymastichus coffea]
MYQMIWLHGIVIYLLANLGLLFRIWWTRDCSGLSAKSQYLFAVALTLQYADHVFLESTALLGFEIVKIVFVALSYAIVVSILCFFKGTYEKRYDTTRISTIVLPMVIWALWIKQDNYCETMKNLGMMLGIVAMVPQFHFISESMRIHTYIIIYIVAMAISCSLSLAHSIVNFVDYRPHYMYEYVVRVADVASLIVYCDFFLRILPWLMYRRDKARMQATSNTTTTDSRTPQPV